VTALWSRDDGVSPDDLRRVYRTVNYVPAAADRNMLGVAGFLNQYPSPADLTEFVTDCRTDAVDATYTVKRINGGEYDPSHPGDEANLNMQYAQPMSYPTQHIFYNTAGGLHVIPGIRLPTPGDRFLEWLKYVIDRLKVPQTISVSYGDSEKIPRWSMQRPYAVCSPNSVRVAPASSSRAATIASAVGTALSTMAPEESSSSPSSLHPVRLAFDFSLEAVHRRRHRSLTTSPLFPRSLCD